MRLMMPIVLIFLQASGLVLAQDPHRTEDARVVPTPPPDITAATSDWQLINEPIVVAGDAYDPAGPNIFFNGWTMVKVGSFRGVPVYTDTTLEPSTVVLVPIGRGIMKRYERRRAGAIVGTAGSKPPALPIASDLG